MIILIISCGHKYTAVFFIPSKFLKFEIKPNEGERQREKANGKWNSELRIFKYVQVKVSSCAIQQ